jgi:predicted  nucleic acid-binding Zn-ribbon protein
MKTSEVMEKKAQAAREKVRELLWNGADADQVADAAIAGGLAAGEVDKIEGEVAEGKAAIERLNKFDLQALAAANERTQAARQKAEAKLEKAQADYDAAEDDAQNATAKLADARTAFEDIATRVSAGKLPATGLPELVETIIAARNAQCEAEDTTGKINALSREVATTETRAAALQAEADKLKKTKSEDTSFQSGGRLQPLADDYAESAATMLKQCKAGNKRIEELKTAATAARERYDTAAALLPW